MKIFVAKKSAYLEQYTDTCLYACYQHKTFDGKCVNLYCTQCRRENLAESEVHIIITVTVLPQFKL